MTKQQDDWTLQCETIAWEYSTKCKELSESNPYDTPALPAIAEDLLTELWDQGFSVSEIKTAFERAVADLPRYTGGEDRRGDKGGV